MNDFEILYYALTILIIVKNCSNQVSDQQKSPTLPIITIRINRMSTIPHCTNSLLGKYKSS